MPIKKIQLRGISRTPSDRMTADGGLAESLNVHLDEQESAPVLPPRKANNDFKPEEEQEFRLFDKPIFIHKGRGYRNLISVTYGDVNTIYADYNYSTAHDDIGELEEGETITDISAVGNTLVVATNKRMMYFLHKSMAGYSYLGENIPMPDIEFQCIGYEDVMDKQYTFLVSDASEQPHTLKGFYNPKWESFLDETTDKSPEDLAEYGEIKNTIWDNANTIIQKRKREGYFSAPLFARYAVRLFDGTYIYQSVPILLGAGKKTYLYATATYGTNPVGKFDSYITVGLNGCYTAKAYLSQLDVSGWEDIITSIDLFLSTDILLPEIGSDITGFENVTAGRKAFSFKLNDEDLEKGRTSNTVLSKTNFYKIASFKVGNLQKLVDGYDLLNDKKIASLDYLIEQDELPDGYLSSHIKNSDALFRYNNRLYLNGIRYVVPKGYGSLNGSIVLRSHPETNVRAIRYEFKYYIKTAGGEEVTVVQTPVTSYSFTYTIYHREDPPETVTAWAEPYGWIAYPDPRCYKVEIRIDFSDGHSMFRTQRMYAHPGLQIAYSLVDLDEISYGLQNFTWPGDSWYEENRTYREDNAIWASSLGNPFLYEASGKLTLYDRVLGIAAITTPLSQGQVGSFSLYIFTEAGIWTAPISDTGEISRVIPVSSDVLLSRKSLCTLEQSVVFISEQGVNLLVGMQVTLLSTGMNGRPYALEDEIITRLAEVEPWDGIYEAADEGEPFMTYMRDCIVAYDYPGRRVLFFKEGKPYLYLYQIETKTWHKAFNNTVDVSYLGGYPNCYISMKGSADAQEFVIWDFSTVLDDEDVLESATQIPGIIVTRPFDLEEPDIRKTIKSIRIRGNYNRNDVRYILLGSFDGIHWQRLHSLRGGSYKLFRMVILTDLSPTERISWIDIDYESRFTNRLR